MGQLLVQGVVLGVVMSVVTTMTPMVTDTSSLQTAVYVLASKYGLGDAIDAENTATQRFLEDSINKLDFDGDEMRRMIRSVLLHDAVVESSNPNILKTAEVMIPVLRLSRRSRLVPRNRWLAEPCIFSRRQSYMDYDPRAASSGRRHVPVFRCHDIVPWARAIIQTTMERDLEDTYYHVPRAAFIHRPASSSTSSLSAGLHIENMLDPTFAANHHTRCHPQCPVRLRLLPPEPDRLWPRNLVVAECDCKETSCSGRGSYQCRQVTTPVLIVRGVPGQLPRYCPEMVPAGCRCIPVRTEHASRFEPFAIT